MALGQFVFMLSCQCSVRAVTGRALRLVRHAVPVAETVSVMLYGCASPRRPLNDGKSITVSLDKAANTGLAHNTQEALSFKVCYVGPDQGTHA